MSAARYSRLSNALALIFFYLYLPNFPPSPSCFPFLTLLPRTSPHLSPSYQSFLPSSSLALLTSLHSFPRSPAILLFLPFLTTQHPLHFPRLMGVSSERKDMGREKIDQTGLQNSPISYTYWRRMITWRRRSRRGERQAHSSSCIIRRVAAAESWERKNQRKFLLFSRVMRHWMIKKINKKLTIFLSWNQLMVITFNGTFCCLSSVFGSFKRNVKSRCEWYWRVCYENPCLLTRPHRKFVWMNQNIHMSI